MDEIIGARVEFLEQYPGVSRVYSLPSSDRANRHEALVQSAEASILNRLIGQGWVLLFFAF